MILRLSVTDPVTANTLDLEVTATPESTVAALLAALPVRVGDRPCYVGTVLLDPDSTLATAPLVSGAVLSVGVPGPDPRRLPAGAVGALRVVSGPDGGLATWMSAGLHLLGRARDAGVRLLDRDVARRQAILETTSWGAMTVRTLDPAHGTAVDGVRITGTAAVPVPPGSRLRVGDDVLEWTPLPASGLDSVRSPDGHLDFDRAFAPAPAAARTAVELPPAPADVPRNVLALTVSTLVPVALGTVMAVVTGRPGMVLFSLLCPASLVATRIVERRTRRARAGEFAAGQDRAVRTIRAAVLAEERLRRRLAPDLVDLVLAGCGADRGLWPRNTGSPDALVLRVGTADATPTVELRGEPWPGFVEPLLRDVPATVDLRRTGVLGVVGTPERTDQLTRWLLVQLAILRGPEDLRLVVITSRDDAELAWTGWLPHLDAGAADGVPCRIGNTPATRAARIAELGELVTRRTTERRRHRDSRFEEEVVVLLDGALALRHLPGMREVLRDGPTVGVYAVCVDVRDLNECHGLCELDAAGLLLTRGRADHPRRVRPEGVDRDVAERLARALAPMRDRLTLASGADAVPDRVRLLDLLGVGVPTAEDVLAGWARRPGPTTEVVLGADAGGPVSVDLARQGPHTMLGGATGAGKSILLQTLVTSLVLANRPDELNLVLVDFKGGGAFLPFVGCPQVVGLIRSTGEDPAEVFDQAAAARVLASVRAEVRRRESVLAPYGGEIEEYWADRVRGASLVALPRLVMVFDEFARVLESSPDFLRELVNVAAKGRSLGMHLVLATQSLQGKLSPELKNNIDLRVTLRQNEAADSVEVLGVPDAVGIPGRLRGRAMIVCTKDETRTPRVFQSGYLGDPPAGRGAPPVRTRLLDWTTLGSPRPRPAEGFAPGPENQPTDLELVTGAVETAASRLGLAPPFRPLLPPLPADLPPAELDARLTSPIPPDAVPVGLVDDPDAQTQPAMLLDLAGTDRLLVAGGPRSGRTTVARALITELATRFRPDQVHLYVLEHHPAGLAGFAGLPHCGAVLSPAEPDRIRRMVCWLDAEVRRRRTARLTPPGPAPDPMPYPHVVVVVDGWEYLENRTDPAWVETSVLTTLRAVVTAGPPVGVHVVALGGAELMNGRLPGLCSQRLLLPFPTEDTRRMHLAPGAAGPPAIPGRAVDAGSGRQVQLTRPVGSPTEVVDQAVARYPTPPTRTGTCPGPGQPVTSGAASPGAPDLADPGPSPRRFPPLPTRVALAGIGGDHPGTWIPLGVGGPEVTPLGLDLFAAGPHAVLVSGPPGSGRSTTLATLAHGLHRIGVGLLVLATPRCPLPGMLPGAAGVRVLTGTTVSDAELREAAASLGGRRVAVLVDDCEQVTVEPAVVDFAERPTLLQEAVTPAALGRYAVLLAGDALPIVAGRRRAQWGVVAEILAGGIRVLLTPTAPPVARELGFALEADQFLTGPPGRGYLALGRQTHLLQVAVPGADDVGLDRQLP